MSANTEFGQDMALGELFGLHLEAFEPIQEQDAVATATVYQEIADRREIDEPTGELAPAA